MNFEGALQWSNSISGGLFIGAGAQIKPRDANRIKWGTRIHLLPSRLFNNNYRTGRMVRQQVGWLSRSRIKRPLLKTVDVAGCLEAASHLRARARDLHSAPPDALLWHLCLANISLIMNISKAAWIYVSIHVAKRVTIRRRRRSFSTWFKGI